MARLHTGSNPVLTTKIKIMFNRIHREITKILYPFDPIGFYVLVPAIIILLFLFT